jgi:hypothetical protein
MPVCFLFVTCICEVLFSSYANAELIEKPHLDWINVGGARSYEYEIAKDVNFKRILLTGLGESLENIIGM